MRIGLRSQKSRQFTLSHSRVVCVKEALRSLTPARNIVSLSETFVVVDRGVVTTPRRVGPSDRRYSCDEGRPEPRGSGGGTRVPRYRLPAIFVEPRGQGRGGTSRGGSQGLGIVRSCSGREDGEGSSIRVVFGLTKSLDDLRTRGI